MSLLSPDPSDGPSITDWVLTFAAVALAAAALGMANMPSAARQQATIADVRDLEAPAKLLEAQLALPDEIKAQIGLAGDDDLDDRTVVVDTLKDRLEAGAHPRLLLVGASIAVALDADEVALDALDLLAEDEEALKRYALLADSLADLATSSGAGNLPVLESDLIGLGASAWLIAKLKERHFSNIGARSMADTSRDTAAARAKRFVDRLLMAGALGMTLTLLGLVIIVLWGLVKRALLAQGLRGLDETTSPFEIASTHRVMVAWFLGFMIVGHLLILITGAFGGGPQARALSTTLQPLIQGGIAITLIQRLGRRASSTVPLSIPLRLSVGPATGGWLGLLPWTIAGLSVGTVLVFFGTALTATFTGEPQQTQTALELFGEHSTAEVRVAIAVAVVLFAPLFEEVLFRGFLYRNLRDLLGPIPAMAASGLLFGLVHLQPELVLPLSGLGFTLALLYERSGTLLAPIAVHAAWNLSQLVVLVILVEG